MEELKKVLLFGVGAVATTYEKAADVVDELVKKGRITVEEGRELGEELKRNFVENTKKNNNTYGSIIIEDDDKKTKIQSYDYALRDEFEILKARVYKLEELIKKEDK